MRDITLVVVSYFTAGLARDAIASARRATSTNLKVVLVDNSCDADERHRLAECGADTVIESPANLGYAGGANLGVQAADTPVVVVSNPDVVFGESCLDRLSYELRGDVALAGPAFHWDRDGRWLLPPADFLDVPEKLSQVIASRFPGAARRRARRRLKRRIEFWRRIDSTPVRAVSGAVMAIDRAWFDRVGGFDPRYELYFEEIDLVRRLARKGGSVRYVPDARCRHLYNQSAGRDAESVAKFHRSESMYLDRWARLARPVFMRVAAESRSDESGFTAVMAGYEVTMPSNGREWLVEASPLPSFDSAAGTFITTRCTRFPEEIWSTYRSSALYLRVVNLSSLEVTNRYVVRRAE